MLVVATGQLHSVGMPKLLDIFQQHYTVVISMYSSIHFQITCCTQILLDGMMYLVNMYLRSILSRKSPVCGCFASMTYIPDNLDFRCIFPIFHTYRHILSGGNVLSDRHDKIAALRKYALVPSACNSLADDTL